MDFVRGHFFMNKPPPVEHFFPQFGVPYSIQVPQIEEKSVQLARGSFVKK